MTKERGTMILVVAAIVLFVLAAADNGFNWTTTDLIAWGLAAFAAAHLPFP